MVLIFSHTASSRLQYISHFIFKELLGIDHRITNDLEKFKNYDAVKINYSDTKIEQSDFNIKPVPLLFETEIKGQSIECFEINNYKAFFKTDHSDIPFDIFAASFYLLSRYEEYLPHTKDMYGRYAHENSIAFKEHFLQLPLINIWVNDFTVALTNKYSSFKIQHPKFKAILTYDIDIAYSYKSKGFIRNAGGVMRSLVSGKFADVRERVKVLNNKSTDPFDSFKKLDQLHQQYQIAPVYFFLVAKKNSLYDKHILPHKDAMWKLIKEHAKKYNIGLHPSWQSGDDLSLLKKEKSQLESMAEKKISIVRYHYLRFNLPDDYQRLIKEEFSDDYSMAYASINGFRASVASCFYWYDLQNEKATQLRIHPFCFMEANAFYEEKLTNEQTFDEMIYYFNVCKRYNGSFSSLWHNHFLGTDKLYSGLWDLYERFLRTVYRAGN